MKQGKIVKGKEYAYFFISHARSNPDKVRVIEKGLKIGRAKGRGVKINFLDSSRADCIVNTMNIGCTWKDWLEEERQQEEIKAQQEIQLDAALKARWGIEGELNKANIGHYTTYNANYVTIRLTTGYAIKLAEFMERVWIDEK